MSVPLTTVRAAKAASRSAASKPSDAVPQADVRRRRFLRLEAADPFRGGHDVEVRPLEQELARERGPVELPGRERAFAGAGRHVTGAPR